MGSQFGEQYLRKRVQAKKKFAKKLPENSNGNMLPKPVKRVDETRRL